VGANGEVIIEILGAPTPVTLGSIAITTLPNKIAYAIGDAFVQDGLVVTGTMSDGSTVIETIVPADITGFDSATAGTKNSHCDFSRQDCNVYCYGFSFCYSHHSFKHCHHHFAKQNRLRHR